MVEEVIEQYQKRISTGIMNEVIGDAVMMNSLPSKGTKRLKIYYASQVSVCPPTIVLFVNDASLSTEPYTRYLTGKIRSSFGFKGTPIHLIFRTREKEI